MRGDIRDPRDFDPRGAPPISHSGSAGPLGPGGKSCLFVHLDCLPARQCLHLRSHMRASNSFMNVCVMDELHSQALEAVQECEETPATQEISTLAVDPLPIDKVVDRHRN